MYINFESIVIKFLHDLLLCVDQPKPLAETYNLEQLHQCSECVAQKKEIGWIFFKHAGFAL